MRILIYRFIIETIMQSTPSSSSTSSSSSSSELCLKLDNWNNIFGSAEECYDEEAFIKFKVRNKLSDEYEIERQDLLRLCGRSQWKKHHQRDNNDHVEVAVIGKWNKTLTAPHSSANHRQPSGWSASPSSDRRLSCSSSSPSTEDDSQSTLKTIILDHQRHPYHHLMHTQQHKQQQQQQLSLTKDSYYVALMRILPNGSKEEQVCPAGVEIQFHILYGKAIFHYEDKCQPYHKGQTIKLKPRMLYKIHNPRPDQYTYLIYLLKVISSSEYKRNSSKT